MIPARSLATPALGARPAYRVLRIALGALVVAASAQVVVPLPFTPVPFTLQPHASRLFCGEGCGRSALLPPIDPVRRPTVSWRP